MSGVGPLTDVITNGLAPPQVQPMLDTGQLGVYAGAFSFTYDGTCVGYQGSEGAVRAIWLDVSNGLLRVDTGPQINWGADVPVVLSGTAPAGATRLHLEIAVFFAQAGPYATPSAAVTLTGFFGSGATIFDANVALAQVLECCASAGDLLTLIYAAVHKTG
jgi:hypothetical protein